jgi:predicted MFS family arabinose efflux permease
MLVALFGTAAVFGIFPWLQRSAAIAALVVVWAAVSQALRPAQMTLIGAIAGAEQRKAGYALNRLAVNLGMSIGPAVGGFLAAWSYVALFVVDGATSFVAALALLRWRRALALPQRSTAQHPAGTAHRDPKLWRLLLAGLPVWLVFFQHTAAMPLYVVRELGYPASFFGAVFTLNTVIIVAAEVPLTVATSAWPTTRVLGLGSLLVGLGFGGLALATSQAAIMATVVLWTAGEMLLFPGFANAVAQLAPEGRQGEYMGLYAMSMSVAFTLGPWLGTWFYEHFSARALWSGTLLVALVSVVAFSLQFESAD